MKRSYKFLNRISYLIIAFILFFLSGCISPAEFMDDPSAKSESSSEAESRFPDFVYDQEKYRYAYGAHAALKEDGYYLVIDSSLHFYDIQSDLVFPLCTKASCIHRDETCNAFIFNRYWVSDGKTQWINDVNGWSSNAEGYQLYYYRDHLYTIGEHLDRGRVLLQYSTDFSERREVVQLDDNVPEPRVLYVEGTIFFHGDFAYYLTCLFDIDTAWGNPDYQTVYTVWKVRLEEKAEPEKLFSFDHTYVGAQCFGIGTFQENIYFIIEHPYYSNRTEKDEYGQEYLIPEVIGGFGSVYRYDVKKGQEELIWSYNSTEEYQNLLGAKGAVPRAYAFFQYILNDEGDYVYLAGCPEHYEMNLVPTQIALVNLKTKEGKILYETPFTSYGRITQLRFDGNYYYFLEIDEEHSDTYLTAIDREGNLMRRYELPLEEGFMKKYGEDHGVPRDQWPVGLLRLLAADGRYIVLGGYDENMYQKLSSKLDFNFGKADSVDNGIGVIDAADFVSGKDVEIRQIYERTYQ